MLGDEYERQIGWRDWGAMFDALPSVRDHYVLDLGCGVGGQAAELVARGAHVIGVDGNDELLSRARSRGLPRADFRRGDLRALPDLAIAFDGAWCSFAAAYFVDLQPVLAAWAERIRPGGWIALIEIDDLFAHEPLSARSRRLLDAYAADALAAKRYDFRMGRRLRACVEHAGLRITKELRLDDREHASSGPVEPAIVAAWAARLERMTLLRAFCADEYERVRDDFLACLARGDHKSHATVHGYVAVR